MLLVVGAGLLAWGLWRRGPNSRLLGAMPLLNGSAAFAGTVTAASFNGSGALPWQVAFPRHGSTSAAEHGLSAEE